MPPRKKTKPQAIQPPVATKTHCSTENQPNSSQISEETAKAANIKGFAFKPLAKNDIGELIRKIFKENASCHG
jgi:hypothetical protein